MNTTDLDTRRLCRYCGIEFAERENLGEWQCWYHPAQYNADQSGSNYGQDQYDCCGRTKHTSARLAQGCVRTHHNAMLRDYTDRDALEFPIDDVQSMGIKLNRETFEIDHDSNTVVVFRCDYEQADVVSAYGALQSIECLSRSGSCSPITPLLSSPSASGDFAPSSSRQYYYSPVPVKHHIGFAS